MNPLGQVAIVPDKARNRIESLRSALGDALNLEPVVVRNQVITVRYAVRIRG